MWSPSVRMRAESPQPFASSRDAKRTAAAKAKMRVSAAVFMSASLCGGPFPREGRRRDEILAARSGGVQRKPAPPRAARRELTRRELTVDSPQSTVGEAGVEGEMLTVDFPEAVNRRSARPRLRRRSAALARLPLMAALLAAAPARSDVPAPSGVHATADETSGDLYLDSLVVYWHPIDGAGIQQYTVRWSL